MSEDEVVIGQKLSPAGLPTVEDFGRHERSQVLVIRKYLNRVTSSFEVMAPMSHRFDNCKHFEVGSPIVAFRRYTLTGEKSNRVPLVAMELTDDARNGETGGISVETNREFGVEMTEDRGRSETTFEFFESFLSLGGPMEILVFAEESSNRTCDAGISLDKSTIKIGKAEKDLDILNRSRNGPFCDGSDAIGFHRNAVRRDDETKEGDGGDVELALAEFASQAIFAETG